MAARSRFGTGPTGFSSRGRHPDVRGGRPHRTDRLTSRVRPRSDVRLPGRGGPPSTGSTTTPVTNAAASPARNSTEGPMSAVSPPVKS
jgi:hypothetical protein